ncbi:MAG: sigma-70 family RNA polymerase sigma factor [Planctomycetales bacterium]|nr:sigma-70 family RNA polymerase sigma factor [Planctomycetales bacterium]
MLALNLDQREDRERTLAAAKAGQTEAIEALLRLYCRHLRILAETQLDGRLKARVSPSDVVQETLFEAHHDIGQFRGSSEPEFLAWLRRILANNLARAFERHILAEKRDVHREVSIDDIGAKLDRSAARFHEFLVDQQATPSAVVDQGEQMLAVTCAMDALPEDYRAVIVMRHLEGLSFAEVAARLGRTPGACRMLWLRAIDQIRAQLSQEGWL